MNVAESIFVNSPISLLKEMGAYEALWLLPNATFKNLADIFRANPGTSPSNIADETKAEEALKATLEKINAANIKNYGVRINGTLDYPYELRDAKHPIEFLYYMGNWDLIYAPKKISVIGTRNPSEEGIRRTKKLVKLLVKEGYVIVSGLARGIDTIAHQTAMENGGQTIAVIGTPITEYYPPENKNLQDIIAKEYLLISQVPIVRYSQQDYKKNRIFFPERNKTMSAISAATIIVEAGETSGTLVQAQAALKQNRKLFILDNCFQNPNLTWPKRFQNQGAIRVTHFDDITNVLK